METKSGVGDLKEAFLKGIGPVDNNLTFKNMAGLDDKDRFSMLRDALFHRLRMLGYNTCTVSRTDPGGMTTLHKVLTDCIVKEQGVKVVVVRGERAVLVENVWFHKEDKKNDPEFAKKLASPSNRYAFSIVEAAMGLKTSDVESFMKEEFVDYQKAKCKGVPLMVPYDSNIINRTCLEEPLVDKEEAWARQLKAEAGAVAPKVVNLIHAVGHQNKDTNVNVPVQMTPHLNRVFHIHNKRPRSEGSSQPPISFSDDDLEGLDLPHDDALVIALKVGDCLVDKILVDQGSACDVLYFHLFEKLGLKPEDLKETDTVISGFNEQEVHPMGVVTLPILAGSLTVQTDFLVVNVSSAYNAVVGRPWLHKIKAIPSSYHQKLKFPTEEGIEEIRGDQNASKACGMIAVKPKTQTDAKELEDVGGKGVTTTITGGGDSVAAVEKVGLLQRWRRLVSWRR